MSLKEISTEVKGFEPISLEEMDSVKLMNRVDTKFVVGTSMFPAILRDAKECYRILEIDGEREMKYRTTYFDTDEYTMYNQHQNGRLNRFKIRTREYAVSGIHFLEVKFKSNKGRTQKQRVIRADGKLAFHQKEAEFLEKSAPYEADQLVPRLWNSFTRLTLVHKHDQERITVDYELTFINDGKEEAYVPQLGIIEVKQGKYTSASDMMKVLKKYGIREMRVSKYCIGSAMLNNDLKRNRFKYKLLAINKLN